MRFPLVLNVFDTCNIFLLTSFNDKDPKINSKFNIIVKIILRIKIIIQNFKHLYEPLFFFALYFPPSGIEVSLAIHPRNPKRDFDYWSDIR